MYNKVILIGNLCKDPELRYTPQGTPVCTIRIASSTKFKSGTGMKEETLFIDCVVWGKQGENVAQYLTKGKSALIEGRLQERKWETDGQQRSKMEIIAQAVKFLGGGRKGESTGSNTDSDDFAPEETSGLEPF